MTTPLPTGDHAVIVRGADAETLGHPAFLTAHAFGAAPGKGAELLIVVAPGIERFEYFRTLERIAYGTVPAESLLAEQERYDTWFLESEAWSGARTST